MNDEPLRIGDILAQARGVALANATSLGVIVVVLCAVNVAIDMIPTTSSFSVVAGFASMIAQFTFFRQALDRAGRSNGGGFGRFWWMNVISTLGMLVAAIALILPAFYLAARWSVAAPLLLSRDMTASESLSESWRIAGASVWRLLGIYLVLFVPVLLLAGGLGVMMGDEQAVLSSAISYPFVFGATAFSWCVQMALFDLLEPDAMDDLAEVFA